MTDQIKAPVRYNRAANSVPANRGNANQEVYAPNNVARYPEPSRRHMGSMMKSFLLMGAGAVALAASEKLAPDAYKISTLLGEYEANIEEEVLAKTKDIETFYANQFEDYKGEVAKYVEASNTAVRAQNDAVLQYYKAAYDRAQVLLQGTVNLRAFIVQKFVNVAETLNSADLGISSGALAGGRLIGLFDPSLGEAFEQYGETGGELAAARLEDFFNRGMAIDIPKIDDVLPAPEDVEAELDDIELPDAPTPPRIRVYGERALGGSGVVGSRGGRE
jgi:hypothetical protein